LNKEFSRIYPTSSGIQFCLLLFLVATLISFGGSGDCGGTSATTELESTAISEASTCKVINTSSANKPLFSYIWHIRNADRYFAFLISPDPLLAQMPDGGSKLNN